MTASPGSARRGSRARALRAPLGLSEGGTDTGTRLVLRAVIGLALVATAWMAPGVAADDAERLALVVTFIWLPLTLVADAVLRRRGDVLASVSSLVADLAVFIPAVALLGRAGAAVAVLQAPVVALHARLGPPVVLVVGSVGAVFIAGLAEVVTDTSVVGDFGFVLLVSALCAVICLERIARTRQMSAADRLAQQFDKAEAIITGVAEAVVVTSATGGIREWNDAATRLFECSKREALHGRCSTTIGLRRDLATLQCATGCELLGDGPDATGGTEVWRALPGGGRQSLLVNASPVFDPDGRVGEVVHAFRDITALRRADEAKTLFLATASHELKTPLAVIRGYSELLLASDDGTEAARREGLEAIHRRAEELTAIVDRLLMSSRIEAGRVNLRPVEGRVDETVLERAEAFEATHGREVVVVHEPPTPPVWMTEDALATVIDHLLENAAKYSAHPRPVEVEVTATASHVVLAVRDRGIGMTHEQLEHCFDKFWQAESTDVRRFGGTGIGLYIVRALVEALGAEVTVESTLGKGSTFHVRLRRCDADGQGGRADAPEGDESMIEEFLRHVDLPTDGGTS